jgi:hypothetical protein
MKLKSFFTKRNKLLIIALIALVVLLVLVNAARTKVLTDAEIIANISSLTNVPDPTQDPPGIFRIEDPSQMPAFFAGSKKGDVAVLFYKSAKAIIYSPSDNRIVNQGPIINEEAPQQKTVTLPAEKKVSDVAPTATEQADQ